MAIGRIPEPGTGIPESIIAAKGDLIVGTANDVPGILTVGTDGHTLVADSVETTGLKWVAPSGGGKVLQVVQSVDGTETTTNTTTWTDTGLSATITPSSASSKILVLTNVMVYNRRTNSETGGGLRILRDSTFIWGDEAASAPFSSFYTTATGASTVVRANFMSFSYLDSPNTTSAITYKVQSALQNTANGAEMLTSYVSDSGMILMEIGA
jgi:hypothetical protein